MRRMNLREITTDFTFYLAAFFAIVVVKILSWGKTVWTYSIIREGALWINGFY